SSIPQSYLSGCPADPQRFDIQYNPTPTSRAPTTARNDVGRLPSKTRSPYAKSWRIHARVRRAQSTPASNRPGGTAAAVGLVGKLRYSAAPSCAASTPSHDARRAPATATAEL